MKNTPETQQHNPPSFTRRELSAVVLTVGDVAAMLNYSPRHVRRLVAEGRIPAPDARVSRELRWRRDTFSRWLDTLSRRAS